MITEDELRELLDFAEELALRAGALLLDALDSSEVSERRADAQVKTSPTDFVTSLDRASEALIVGEICRARPDDALLGEEGSGREGKSGLCWVIDPLDGTTNFVYGYGSFAVSIGLTDGIGPLLGVVHDPKARETFRAGRGLGAYLNRSRLALGADPVPLDKALLGTGFAYTAELRADQALLLCRVLPAVRDIRRGGSAALDLCSVACGRLDGYYEAGLEPWDRAAGVLIATESGNECVDVPDLVPRHETLVVGAPQLLPQLIGLLTQAGERATPTKNA